MTAQTTQRTHQKGFTLIELLVVIGILAVLLAITLIAINPARQFSQANDTKRRSDINAILNAIHQYGVEYNGVLPGAATDEIPTAPAAAADIADTGADICSFLVPTYIAALPSDPQAVNGGVNIEEVDCAGAYNTEYRVVQTADPNNRITVEADGEIETEIQVTR